MSCPHCRADTVHRRKERTALGYRRFWCASCRRHFNERTGTPFNELQYPTDVVLLAVPWRLRYKLSFRNGTDQGRCCAGAAAAVRTAALRRRSRLTALLP